MAKKKQSKVQRADAKDDLVFKALSNSDRRRILDLIRQSPKTTGELCDAMEKMNRCTVMLHMNILEEAGLIIVKRAGRHRWNYLDIEPIQRVYNRWIKDYAQPAAGLLTQLKNQLET